MAAPAAGAAAAPVTDDVDAEAFKRLYPDQYYQRFLAEGVRPDGRPIGRARAVTIGAGTITTADGSALVKVGRTTVLAGVRLEIMRPDETAPAAGALVLSVEMAPFSSADYRPGRAPDHVSAVVEKLSSALLGSGAASSAGAAAGAAGPAGGGGAVQLGSLCIAEGKAAWRALLDVYVLDADGCVLDAALLAAVAALRDTRIPAVRNTREGHYYAARGASATAAAEEGKEQGSGGRKGGKAGEAGLVEGSPTAVGLGRLPLALTCCLYGKHVLVDPTADEERLAGCGVTVVVDGAGQLQGLYKAGGRVLADTATLVRCTEAARLRHRELSALLDASLVGQ
ncbi:hypothetical protein CHLRE_10g440900v5 [Chlamydomonas reinhardtii]|uniref:Ribosomal RNA-processing protein 43 n=1 Tax=Chlamydomonas reinhardtii TaxID=3055 RepID=A0A2K3DAH0_CHLRE|nr:uncharacterized protein CHLRE_10g440900v5 [Chlamydomonas reinhardtii]PNW77535.1 hypothetical protein CHLRE_10g440900v5 [Chlamydomonas reinhardtii]